MWNVIYLWQGERHVALWQTDDYDAATAAVRKLRGKNLRAWIEEAV